ncbi:MAG: methylated-DNA-[protein]-cysteine S-methyltransferase [Solirubrobacteraceae bacterium]|jgi:methylated-DNA-[protein]-cysteine S-methyltransferase|nr:methylated-DNA-[protein]-cysteine S-methyltransferase [Solirubrobacteraceae bacterium]
MSTMTSTRTHTVIGSPVGDLTVVADDGALVGLYFEQHLRQPAVETFGERTDDGFAAVRAQLGEYFAGTRRDFDLELRPVGDAFKQRVWALLRQVPYGETRSYGDLARELGDRNLAQAVGHANALNPLSVVVPCHRVVASDGKLTGYAGGLERKRFLLDLEAPAADEAGRLF